MNTIKTLIMGLSVVAGVLFTSSVVVAEPMVGQIVGSKFPLVACDTHDEALMLVNAIKTNTFKEALAKQSAIVNSNKEPSCVYTIINPTTIDSVEKIGKLHDDMVNTDLNFWIVSVHNQYSKFFIILAENDTHDKM